MDWTDEDILALIRQYLYDTNQSADQALGSDETASVETVGGLDYIAPPFGPTLFRDYPFGYTYQGIPTNAVYEDGSGGDPMLSSGMAQVGDDPPLGYIPWQPPMSAPNPSNEHYRWGPAPYGGLMADASQQLARAQFAQQFNPFGGTAIAPPPVLVERSEDMPQPTPHFQRSGPPVEVPRDRTVWRPIAPPAVQRATYAPSAPIRQLVQAALAAPVARNAATARNSR
jgi:hypothetical protein